jgi:hypothetical protein
MAGTPEMQVHFPAGSSMAESRKTKSMVIAEGMPKMQEQFSAGA